MGREEGKGKKEGNGRRGRKRKEKRKESSSSRPIAGEKTKRNSKKTNKRKKN